MSPSRLLSGALGAGAEEGSGLFAIDGGRLVGAAWFAHLEVLDAWMVDRKLLVTARTTLCDPAGPTPRAETFELVGFEPALDAALAGGELTPPTVRRSREHTSRTR